MQNRAVRIVTKYTSSQSRSFCLYILALICNNCQYHWLSFAYHVKCTFDIINPRVSPWSHQLTLAITTGHQKYFTWVKKHFADSMKLIIHSHTTSFGISGGTTSLSSLMAALLVANINSSWLHVLRELHFFLFL